jgi:cytosine/adenosine deaminase-related metal-dependent hydrolase
MRDLFIRYADYLITVDKDRRIILDGAIAIGGGRIEPVGKTADIHGRFPDAEAIDGGGLAGLSRTVRHVHPQRTAARARPWR